MMYQNFIHIYILIIGHDLITLNVQTKIYNETRVIYIQNMEIRLVIQNLSQNTLKVWHKYKISKVIGIEGPGKLNNTSL